MELTYKLFIELIKDRDGLNVFTDIIPFFLWHYIKRKDVI